MQGYIGLGSNLGEPAVELREALTELPSFGVEIVRLSSFYRTEPVESPESGWFVNAACEIRFAGEPLELLRICLAVEKARGRVRSRRNAPRTLDLDLLLLEDLVIDTDRLVLPHPRLHERRFVLVPMAEIAADVVHPVLRKTMRELLSECRDESEVVLLEDALA